VVCLFSIPVIADIIGNLYIQNLDPQLLIIGILIGFLYIALEFVALILFYQKQSTDWFRRMEVVYLNKQEDMSAKHTVQNRPSGDLSSIVFTQKLGDRFPSSIPNSDTKKKPILITIVYITLISVVIAVAFRYRNIVSQHNMYLDTMLHNCRYAGPGYERNYTDQEKCFEQYSNDPRVQNYLGFMSERGNVDPQDFKRAAELYALSAQQGYARAEDNLGLLYYNGKGVPKDFTKAAELFRKAAYQRYAPAENHLGIMYDNAEILPQDLVQAAFWFRKAADQNDGSAQANLGTSYHLGRGVTQDDAQAAIWYQKAAAKGIGIAEQHLGQLYEVGSGVPQNNLLAAELFHRASIHEFEPPEFAIKIFDYDSQGIP
jgi:hypothetical protein